MKTKRYGELPLSVVILGAGPTGLGAAWQLQSHNFSDWLLLEASGHAGGLAASFLDEAGFTWDVGGHVQFSHYEYFDQVTQEVLGNDEWLYHERESWIWMRNRFIPYPLQNNIRHLPPNDLVRCLKGLVEITRSRPSETATFRDWIHATFGDGLTEVFMEPYNFKVWAHPLEMLNKSWVGERVAVPDLSLILENIILNRDDITWGPNNKFRFPKKGGSGAVWVSLASRLPQQNIRYNCPVVRIDLKKHELQTKDGSVYQYEKLISTVPLTDLVRLSNQQDLMEVVGHSLLHSTSNIVGLGLRGQPREELAKKCWMYFPEDNCPFYRVTVFSNYSPQNVPVATQQWSLMFEVSESAYKPVDRRALIQEVIDGALNTRLISKSDEIVSTWQYCANHGYPIPSLKRDKCLAESIPFFEDNDVYTRGRFGLWKYEVSNQDHSFMQGVEVVERLLNRRQEITGFDAAYVNSGRHPWPFERWTKKSG